MKPSTLLLLVAALGAALSPGYTPGQTKDNRAEVTLQSAIKKEVVDGDLKAAIEQYKKLAQNRDQAVAAKALLRMGECYEKLGDTEARKAYERLVKEFGDSKEASQARAKLTAMNGKTGAGGLTTELLWQGGDRLLSAVSTDRPFVAFTDWAAGDLVLRDLVTGETRAVKSKEFAQMPLISADGKLVVYGWDAKDRDRSEIRSINSDGTNPRTHLSRTTKTTTQTEYISPVALSPDKKTAIVKLGSQVEALSLADNSVKPFGEGVRVSEASFSPDGKQVVLSGDKEARGDTGSDLFLANADGSGVRPLLTESGNDNSPFWTPDGKWIVFLSDRTGSMAVWAIPSSGGTPRLLKEDKGIENLHGLTRDGSLYYSTFVSQHDVHVARLDPATLAIKGEPSRFINTFLGRNGAPSFSPDGKWIAWLSAREPGGPTVAGYVQQGLSVVVQPAAGGEEKVMPLAKPLAYQSAPRWFPDSKALLNRRGDHGQAIFERVEVPDGRITELYRGTPLQFVSFAVAPDGNALLGLRCNGSAPKPCDLVRYDLRTKSETVETLSEIRVSSPVMGTPMEISPDGKWLAILGRPLSGSGNHLFVKPTAGGRLVELTPGLEAQRIQGGFAWTRDSKQILYSVWAPSRGIWDPQEFRVVPVEGGTPKTIPVRGTVPSLDPDWRLAYTVDSTRDETWVLRNLPLN